MKILLILGHPHLGESLANQTIIKDLQNSGLGIDMRHIAELYPDYNIDPKVEQEELLRADTVVFQYPFYWYSMPAILKQWFDMVFEYGFAYGSTGDKLQGKHFLASFTIGGPKESYCAEGYNTFEIQEFCKNLEQTANLAQMHYVNPVYSHGMIYIPNVYNTRESVMANAHKHAKKLIEILRSLKS